MNNHYYLIASLPKLDFPQDRWKIEVEEVYQQIMENLEGWDLRLAKYMIYPNDNQNLIKSILDKRGDRSTIHDWQIPAVFPPEVMENYQNHLDRLPSYMLDFLESSQQSDMSPSQLERDLWQKFYDEMINCGDHFVENYYLLELNLKKILAAFNGRHFNLEFQQEIIFESDINQNLIKSSASDFGIGQYFPFLDKLNEAFESGEVSQLETEIDQILWNYIEDITRFSFFNTHQVLAYLKKLMIVKRWMNLSEEEGKKRLEELVDGIMNDFELPKLN